MASAEIKGKEKWEKAHAALSHALGKEIDLMRELLSNLHQEELSLLESDTTRWAKVMRERSDMILPLGKIRLKRALSIEKLEKLAKEQQRAELFPPEEELSCEIFSKLDQEIALLERINLQNCRNDALFDQVRHKDPSPLYCPFPHPLHKPRRKTSVATKKQLDVEMKY